MITTENNGEKKRKEAESNNRGKERGTHSEPKEKTRKHGDRKPEEKQKRKKQDSESEERPRKRKKQITIEQCMNKNGKRTREKLQRTPNDAENSESINDTITGTGKQITERSKETRKRPRTEIERTGIG